MSLIHTYVLKFSNKPIFDDTLHDKTYTLHNSFIWMIDKVLKP